MNNYHDVIVTIGQEERHAICFQDTDGMFDLLHGWPLYSSGPHSTLDLAIQDLKNHLQNKYPTDKVILCEPSEITETQAAKCKADPL